MILWPIKGWICTSKYHNVKVWKCGCGHEIPLLHKMTTFKEALEKANKK